MRENILNRLLIICCVLIIVGCKAKKQAIVERKAVDSAELNAANTRSKLNAIIKNQASFNSFSGKAKAKLSINGNSNDVTLTIRIAKGQKIWVSITAIAGIEVARALITPDSLLVINRLQGVYLRKPFSYIYRYSNKEIDYNSLEAIFVGNAMPQLLNENAKLQTDKLTITLQGNLEDLLYHLIVGLDMRVTQTDLKDQAGDMSLTVTNSQFIQSGSRIVPSQIDIGSTAKRNKIVAGLHYSKVDFDLPLEYPFSIPSRYDPAN
jgi:hypothetical protein